ncbi:MAG TPA: respiratory nitrate reductase subunit gamma [Gaiellaceae bacterium]|nr:respiratory nitrate reductase subunit gamma [Gaiellaceae bacterium]
MNALPWIVVPYLAAALFVGGHVWRWRFDRLGWTSRSSQLLEQRWLRVGSPLFHVGLLGVVGGHVIGILVPARATRAVGVSDHVYHVVALAAGSVFGMLALAGIVILTLRRLLVRRVRRNGTPVDIAVDLFLLAVIGLGMGETLGWQLGVGEYAYRETVSIWFRQLLLLHPDASLMSGAPWVYQAHTLASLTLFALWPFSRLVHVWAAPVQYVLRRAHILYRPAPAETRRATLPQRP